MKTSYFANLRNIDYPVCITLGTPSFYHGATYPKLAPKYSFLSDYKNGVIGPVEYTEQYVDQVLDVLDVHETWQEIVDIYKGVDHNDIALICYEKPSDFCHRHLVSIWFRQAGYEINEMQ